MKGNRGNHNRFSHYSRSKGSHDEEHALMKLIDRQYPLTPFYGLRETSFWLRDRGYVLNRKPVRCLMSLVGLRAISRHTRTGKPAPGHKVYPYLLGGMKIARLDQVRAADITYQRHFQKMDRE